MRALGCPQRGNRFIQIIRPDSFMIRCLPRRLTLPSINETSSQPCAFPFHFLIPPLDWLLPPCPLTCHTVPLPSMRVARACPAVLVLSVAYRTSVAHIHNQSLAIVDCSPGLIIGFNFAFYGIKLPFCGIKLLCIGIKLPMYTLITLYINMLRNIT